MVVNVIGLMPLGIVFYGSLQCFSGPFTKHNRLLAVVFCLLLSLRHRTRPDVDPDTAFQPPDLILNTFGAWLGIGLWRLVGGGMGQAIGEPLSVERGEIDRLIGQWFELVGLCLDWPQLNPLCSFFDR